MLLERLSAGGSSTHLPPQVMEVALLSRPESVAQARHALAAYAQARTMPVDMVDDGILAISELVSNVVLHAKTPFVVWAEYDAGHLILAVLDGSPALPSLLPFDDNREGGRGTAIIDALGASWGIIKTALGKVVWVDFASTVPVPDPRVANGPQGAAAGTRAR